MKSRNKGRSIIDFPANYIILDIETTGLSPEYDDIIEIAYIEYNDNNLVGKYNQLIKPAHPIDDFITSLTGITNKMLDEQPTIEDILPQIIHSLQNKLIIGHNIKFDINFIYDKWLDISGEDFQNDYIDTMRIARKLLPELPHHRLKDLIMLFNINISKKQHRALNDCEYTQEIYSHLINITLEKYNSLSNFKNSFKKKNRTFLNLKSLTSDDNIEINEDNPFYKKECVFTGKLDRLTRKEAAQLVVNLGGSCGNSITKNTNFLILGNLDYSPNVNGEKSKKRIKAENLILKGQNLTIIPENEFYDLILG